MGILKTKGITAKELLAFLPLELLEQKAIDTGVDKNVKKLFGKDIFLLLLIAVLDSERVSLRIMEDLYSTPKFQLLSGVEENSKTKFTSLSDRLINIDVGYFEALFKTAYENLSKHFCTTQIQKHSIIRFDSTTISASAKLLTEGMSNGMPNSKSKEHAVKQIKFTIGFDGLFTRTVNTFTDQNYLGEDLALGETIAEYGASKDSVVVFDRGLKKRTTFAKFTEQTKLFVTRINPTKNYKVISTNEKKLPAHTQSLEYISDEWIYFLKHEVKKLKVPFRLIIAKRKEDGQLLYFVTNIKKWTLIVLRIFINQDGTLKFFFAF